MPKRSAGLLLHRRDPTGALEVLLVHPGGPYWTGKDDGAWSIPKGEYEEGEDPFRVACREVEEELGAPAPSGDARDLGEVRQRGGKRVTAWAVEADLDVSTIHSNTFEMEWPLRSGRLASFPEVDRAGWFTLTAARVKLLDGQRPFLDRLVEMLEHDAPGD